MHKPIFDTDLEFHGDFLADSYNNYSNNVISKWSPILDSRFSNRYSNLPTEDYKLLCFYIEWMSNYDDSQTLILNIQSLIVELDKIIDKPEFNLVITNKVYNPILRKERYEVLTPGGIKKIIDFDKTFDKPMLIDLYPTKFFESIGQKGLVRKRKLEDILDEG